MEPALTISGGEFSVSCFLLETKNEIPPNINSARATKPRPIQILERKLLRPGYLGDLAFFSIIIFFTRAR